MSGGASEEVRAARVPASPLWRHWRIALLALGVLATGLVVRRLGPANVARTLLSAGPFLPLVMLLEASWMGMDVFVLRALLGGRARRAPPSAYVRSAITAYAVMILFPAGRASAEVTRAALLSTHLGPGPVARAAVQMQGASMLGTAAIAACALLAALARSGEASRLPLLIAAGGALNGALGAMFLLGARAPRVWAFLKKRIKLLPDLADTEGDPTSSSARAVLLSFVGRSIQCVLFVVVVFAATGVASLRLGSIAQGISVAGSTFGDAVPQQAGVVEGAFFYFAGALGVGDAPVKAVAVALLIRASQLLLAALCLIVGVLWKKSLPLASREEDGIVRP